MPRRATVTSSADLVATATTLVERHGVAGVRLSDLAHAAGVSVGTVYNHFPSKAHLLAAVARQVESSFVEAMDEAAPAAGPLRPAVPALVDALLDAADRAPAARVLAELGPDTAPEPHSRPTTSEDGTAIRAWVTRRVERAQRSGEVAEVDAALVAELAFALVRAALQQRSRATSRPEQVRLLLAAALTSMLPAPHA